MRKMITLAAALLVCAAANAASNLAARAKAFAKLPDWSGLWEKVPDYQQNLGQDAVDAEARRRYEEQLKSMHPPLNAQLEAHFQAYLRDPSQLPDSSHLRFGFPTMMIVQVNQFFLLVTPEQTALIASTHDIRNIYADGRSHPPKDALWPTPTGDSIGHWVGATLVVDTVATKPEISVPIPQAQGGFKVTGMPTSDQLHYIERLRLLSSGELEDQLTIEDPVALTKPWTQTFRYRRTSEVDRIIYDDDDANDRNPVVNGKGTILER